jgi:uncharacterized protein (TIGR02246 family)
MWRVSSAAAVLTLIVALASCQTAPGARAPAVASVEAELSAHRATHAKSWNDGDAVAWSNHFAPDGRFVGALSNRVVDGRAAIATHFAQTFRTFSNRQYRWIDPTVRVYGDVAVEIGACEMKMTDAAGQPRTVNANYSITRVKRDGRWEILHMHTSPRPGP